MKILFFFFFNVNIHLSLDPFLPCPQLSYHLLLERYRELVTARLNIKWSSKICYHQPNKFQLKDHKNDTERFLVVETDSEVLLHQSLRPLFFFFFFFNKWYPLKNHENIILFEKLLLFSRYLTFVFSTSTFFPCRPLF